MEERSEEGGDGRKRKKKSIRDEDGAKWRWGGGEGGRRNGWHG